jgi:hypothetical protein
LYRKTKEKLYITAGSEFSSTLFGNNLIIKKSLYGLKTSAAKFHEHLAESLLRLGCTKTMHDSELWMIERHHAINTWLPMLMIFLFGVKTPRETLSL